MNVGILITSPPSFTASQEVGRNACGYFVKNLKITSVYALFELRFTAEQAVTPKHFNIETVATQERLRRYLYNVTNIRLLTCC